MLRKYEPVVRFTRGELFLPTAVGPYVEQCSLWAGWRHGEPELVVPRGELTLERLSDESLVDRGRRLFLRFVEEPLARQDYLLWARLPREQLSASGRFTTTGVFGRLVDAGVRASLLLRGKVPAGLAAAAETVYRQQLEADRFTYYGRVARDGGYTCLQYWFFYAMNDWRSTFGGINDHEADWEMITIYLAEEPGALRPAWVAFSSHEYQGDDLRRRWDDPELRREGERPVVFAGAGSHSGAFIPGDYVISVDPPQVRPVLRFMRRMQHLLAPWRHYTGTQPGLGIPFVDYARGDGVAIGPGHEAGWNPVVIDDETPWVSGYRGLWGLDTQDRFGGEQAPSGPRYERDGSVRGSWANPLGWAGLQKVVPGDEDVRAGVVDRIAELESELSELDLTIDAVRTELRGLRAQARSLSTHDFAAVLAERRLDELAKREAALNQTIAARTSLAEERRAHLSTLTRPIPPEPAQAHVRRSHRPYVEQSRRTRFLRIWAAISTPLLLGSFIVLLVGSSLAWFVEVAILVCVFIGVEAIARGRFISFLGSLALLVATLAVGIGFVLLLLTHWRTAGALLLGAAALAVLFGNLRAARGR